MYKKGSSLIVIANRFSHFKQNFSKNRKNFDLLLLFIIKFIFFNNINKIYFLFSVIII